MGPRDNLRRQQWLNEPRRSELLVNMEPVMVLPSVNPSKRWKSLSTQSIFAHSAARKTWSARLLVSGNVTSKIAVSPSPEVLGPIQPLLQPQSDLPSEDGEK